MKKKVLILVASDYRRQPRVITSIESIKSDSNITVASFQGGVIDGVNFLKLKDSSKKVYWYFDKPWLIRLPFSAIMICYHKLLRFLNRDWYYEFWTNEQKDNYKLLEQLKPDVIISHGMELVLLANKLKNNRNKLVFNAHEYYPLEFEQNSEWLVNTGSKYKRVLKYLSKRIDVFITVSNGIKDKFANEFGVEPVVITNATKYRNLAPTSINKNEIKIIHHGVANRERQIEHMISIRNYLPSNYHIFIMLTEGDDGYLREIKELANNMKGVTILDPIAIELLPEFLNSFDIGFYILPPVNFNTRNALPNKFFEFVQARLCLVFSPLYEVSHYIKKYEIGLVSKDFNAKSMAEAILSLSVEQISNAKYNSESIALELSSDANMKLLSELILGIKK